MPVLVGSKLFLGEAAPVVIVHAVPALSIAIRPILRVAALGVAEALCPALVITHHHRLRARRRAIPGAGRPTFPCLTARIAGTEPALLLALLGAPHPPLALRNGEANL